MVVQHKQPGLQVQRFIRAAKIFLLYQTGCHKNSTQQSAHSRYGLARRMLITDSHIRLKYPETTVSGRAQNLTYDQNVIVAALDSSPLADSRNSFLKGVHEESIVEVSLIDLSSMSL